MIILYYLNISGSILERYKNYNGVDGNWLLTHDPTSFIYVPDVEDTG
jgi:hypothetical protein